MAQNNMIHSADFNDCRLTTEGRWLADQVRTAADPMARAKSLITLLTDTTSMDAKQAEVGGRESAVLCVRAGDGSQDQGSSRAPHRLCRVLVNMWRRWGRPPTQ